MNKRDYLLLAILFFLGIITRVPLIEKMQSHWDGPQYSIGIVRYSLEQHTPAPPGYPLYIAMGRIFYTFTREPHQALLVLSVIFSGIGAVIFYKAGKIIFNQKVGIISALLFLSGPTFYFFGLTAYPYGLIPIAVTSLVLCSYLIVVKKKKLGFVIGCIFAFTVGLRPQESLMLIPMFLLAFYYLLWKERILAIVGFLTIFAGWAMPFIQIVGGLEKYKNTFYLFLNDGAIQPFSFENSFSYILRMVKGLFLSFTLGSIFLGFYLGLLIIFFKKRKVKKILTDKNFQFFSAWIIPSLIINLLIRSDHAGYQMTYLSGLLILIAYAIWKINRNNSKRLIVLTILIIIFNLFTFFRDRDPGDKKPYVPTSFHYSEIRKNDKKLSAKINYVKSHFNPEKTIIITTGDYWRPAMYYLPQFRILNIPGLATNNQRFKFIIRDSKNWNTNQWSSQNQILNIPKGIEFILFFDDESYRWLSSFNKEKYNIDYLSDITVLYLSKETYRFKLNFFSEIR